MKLLLNLIYILVLSLLVITDSVASNKKAVEFELPHLSSQFQSDTNVNLTDYKGKVVYLDFWASWCKPCKKSFPVLNDFHNKYQAQDFVVIAINLDENKHNALAFLKAHPVDYAVLYDQAAIVAEKYDVQAMPSSFFIDKKGVIRLAHQGYVKSDNAKIQKVIEMLVNEN